MDESRQLLVVELGLRAYAEALEIQREAARKRITGEIDQDMLLLVEHPHVITLGRSTKLVNLVASREDLEARGIELFEVERGGDVTYHGPGQLVGYPIIDLKRHRQDLHWYLRQVEEALITALRRFGIEGARSPGFTGVWVEGGLGGATAAPRSEGQEAISPRARKIASIGVHARDWVTWHGFALNVTTDLARFDAIVPCGITDVTMTSIERELPHDSAVDMVATRERVVEAFGEVFGLQPRPFPEGLNLGRSMG
ncbi:MAG: lipoyl(octanoyl) transferase LipB [Gemmatimonadaceae bacterium]|nr:lipoyl(octanoyl) transferase LipB [Gemmatimonadaceae bacterium]